MSPDRSLQPEPPTQFQALIQLEDGCLLLRFSDLASASALWRTRSHWPLCYCYQAEQVQIYINDQLYVSETLVS